MRPCPGSECRCGVSGTLLRPLTLCTARPGFLAAPYLACWTRNNRFVGPIVKVGAAIGSCTHSHKNINPQTIFHTRYFLEPPYFIYEDQRCKSFYSEDDVLCSLLCKAEAEAESPTAHLHVVCGGCEGELAIMTTDDDKKADTQ